jgi:hypothetical protein
MDKRPLIAWREYQTRRAAPEELLSWFRSWPAANLAIVTGAISGLVVLDLDPAHGGMESWRVMVQHYGPVVATPSAISGGGGRHLYFAHPGTQLRNRAGLRPGMDMRGDGGYIVAPPSRHASGTCYQWEQRPETCALGPVPEWLLPARLTRAGRTPVEWRRLVREGVDQGRRNQALASLAGHLLRRGVDPEAALELLLGWNATRCRPPMPSGEVVRTVVSIQRAHARGPRPQNLAPSAHTQTTPDRQA